ncbi:prepilin peptidase [Chromobacterium phragmitis]|uniref:Prepilin leader peptidase/N-methyltransferase n=1 Tax=Chromobacterium phragmitis TaxID=2202141 RepID=A0ABV0IMJ3_9NEIS
MDQSTPSYPCRVQRLKNALAFSGSSIALLAAFTLLKISAPPHAQSAGIMLALGLAFGSFLNALAYRLPIMIEQAWLRECREAVGLATAGHARVTLSRPRSHCPACGHELALWELIPVISYIWLRGRCHSCGRTISLRYPSVELAIASCFALIGWTYGFQLQTLGLAVFVYFLAALALIDLDARLLPDALTQPLLWLGLLANTFQLQSSLNEAVIGAAAGYALMWSIAALSRLATGKDGLGEGDFKLVAAMAAWLGWPALPLIILLSFSTSAAIGTMRIKLRLAQPDSPQPFGPYLVAAGLASLIWGRQIIDWYLRIALSGY